MELSRDKIKEIINDDWLLMDDCEGNKNCDVVKELARISLASLELERGMIRRFDLDMSNCDSCGQDCGADMVEDLDGEYVLWDDVLPHLYRYDEYTATPSTVSVPLAIHDEDFEKALSVLNDTLDDCGDSELGLLLALDKAGIEVRSDACRAAMLQSGNFRENKNSSTNNFREIAETSTNYPVIPSEVLSAILKVAKIRADFDDFDGDRRGIGDCLDEAEQELIVTINKYASQLAVVPVGLDERAAFNAWNNDENLPIAGVGAKNAAWLAWQARAELGRSLAVNSPVTPDSWVPVSERMPEPYEYVLVTDGFDGCEVMRVNTDGYWGPAKSLYPGSITHWMPLPEPPQEVK